MNWVNIDIIDNKCTANQIILIKFTAYIMNIEKNMSFAQEKCHFAQMAFFLCFFIV